MNIVCIGAGNVATHIAKALFEAGFTIAQVVSRTEEHAACLAKNVGADWTTDLQETKEADIYLYSVNDAALEEVIRCNPQPGGLHVHTAGSMPLSVISKYKQKCGVVYPLQTFSKTKTVDFREVPLFIEAGDDKQLTILKTIVHAISPKIYEAGSEQRRQLHLAAVFACNFTNHLFAIADILLKEAHLPFEVLHPLIRETVEKTVNLSPLQGQTGPAIRDDKNVMAKHIMELSHHPQWQEIYRLLSESIQKI